MNITSTASYNVGNSMRPSYMSQQQDMADPIKVNPTDTGVATEEKMSPVEQKMEDKKQYREEMKQKERRETDRDEFFDKQQQRNQEIATHMKEALTSHNFYNVGNDHDLALTKDNYEETVKGLFNKGFTVQSDDRQLTITSKLHQLKLEMSKESYNKYVELAYGQKFAEQVTGTSSADKKSSAVNSAGIYTNQIGGAAVKTASAAATTVGSVMNGTLQSVSSSSIGVKVESQVSGITEALKVEAYTPQHQNEAAAATAQPQPVNTTQETAASQPAPSNLTTQNTTTSSSGTNESTSTASTSNTGHTAPAAEPSSSATSSSNQTSPTPAPAPTASTTSEPAPLVTTSPAPVSTATNSPIVAAPVAAFTTTPTSSPTTVPTSTTTSPAPTTVAPASTSTTTVPTNTATTAPTSTTAAPTSATTTTAGTTAPTTAGATVPTSTTGTLAGVVNTTVTATTNTLNTTTSATKNLVGGLRK